MLSLSFKIADIVLGKLMLSVSLQLILSLELLLIFHDSLLRRPRNRDGRNRRLLYDPGAIIHDTNFVARISTKVATESKNYLSMATCQGTTSPTVTTDGSDEHRQ